MFPLCWFHVKLCTTDFLTRLVPLEREIAGPVFPGVVHRQYCSPAQSVWVSRKVADCGYRITPAPQVTQVSPGWHVIVPEGPQGRPRESEEQCDSHTPSMHCQAAALSRLERCRMAPRGSPSPTPPECRLQEMAVRDALPGRGVWCGGPSRVGSGNGAKGLLGFVGTPPTVFEVYRRPFWSPTALRPHHSLHSVGRHGAAATGSLAGSIASP